MGACSQLFTCFARIDHLLHVKSGCVVYEAVGVDRVGFSRSLRA